MGKIFYDSFFGINEIPLNSDCDIFESILDSRKDSMDKERFYIKFLPSSEYQKFDFGSEESIDNFRDICFTMDTPLLGMGGCNLWERYMDDFRRSGKKISDPYGRVYGSFDIRNGIITYCPLFNQFYKEYDVGKFASSEYFTTMTFEDIMKYQIMKAHEFYVHTGYNIIKGNREFILEKINSSEMMDFVNEPKLGEMILRKKI